MNHLDRLKEKLSQLDFVQWDRFTHPVSDEYHCYGWINKKSSDSDDDFTIDDFVILTFWDDYEKFWWITSSDKYRAKIGEIIDGDTYEEVETKKVGYLFPELKNTFI